MKPLKKAGLKLTLPRRKILDMFENAHNHNLSAEMIFKSFLENGEDIALATIYRVLTQFEGAGIIVKHNFEGNQAVYELDHGVHHDHLVCIKCNSVQEFMDSLIEERQQKIAANAHFTITDHQLNIFGICRDCQNK